EGHDAVLTSAGCSTTTLPASDDGSSGRVSLPFALDFFGKRYSSLYVNTNGNVTFDGPLDDSTPFPLGSSETPIIAPFFADVDTRGEGSRPVTYGPIETWSTHVDGHSAFCVDWVNVGYSDDHSDHLNSFQLVLVDRSDTGAGN